MKYQSVLTLAPLRISFIGGGTDIKSFYSAYPGKVISAAINKYVYVHIKRHDPLFQERFRISYSQVEHTESRGQIKNGIVKSCLELLGVDEPLQISTSADLPASSGLGSSSSFATALLQGLHSLSGRKVNAKQLAEEASYVEIEMLKEPIGKQDQYAAAFGGLNYCEFRANEKVKIEHLENSFIVIEKLFKNSCLIWTGETRSASTILKKQEQNAKNNFDNLKTLTSLTMQFKKELNSKTPNFKVLGSIIKNGWEIKQLLSTSVNTLESQKIMDELEDLNSIGFKLLGAGGGGFVYAIFNGTSSIYSKNFPARRVLYPKLDTAGARTLSLI
jgi:D-glycero-alpha-D-manno-heptose-7-phosphate kinase